MSPTAPYRFRLDLTARLQAVTAAVPDTNLLNDAVAPVHDALEHGDPIAVKHLLGQSIHHIEIHTDGAGPPHLP